MRKIVFIGSGAIATAIGDVLAEKNKDEIYLLSIEKEVIEMINTMHVNTSYFPKCQLSENLHATDDKNVLLEANVIFLAIPSTAVVGYLMENKDYINPTALVVNLAKGFGSGDQIIPDSIKSLIFNPFMTLKGPSFAREIINRQDTGLTAAATDECFYKIITDVFDGTMIRTDFTTDVTGVEYASILKNIYAIVIGMVDAHFDSANLRSIFITMALNEMRRLITTFGGDERTMYNYCGFGDFSLTSLNDMSRNRTLGLLIGKGFFNSCMSDSVVLEGRIAVDVFYKKLVDNNINVTDFPLMNELYHVLNDKHYPTRNFIKNILKN
ncbi:MAG: NAD(P)-binding domain-containing protein [Bacteroidales bacterium]|nr:NAD(P)-binding domain-containing protein [Bacteroidales bacterium]MBQ3844541.1 NAD(P)-binding domain-containing protein [Bacteroidales bacterium]